MEMQCNTANTIKHRRELAALKTYQNKSKTNEQFLIFYCRSKIYDTINKSVYVDTTKEIGYNHKSKLIVLGKLFLSVSILVNGLILV